MKPIKITSFEQIDALYAKGLNICNGCKFENYASCTPERFSECTAQANKHAKPILVAMAELEATYKAKSPNK